MPPLIGITTYPPDEQGRLLLPREYGEAVRRAGGIPILIGPGEPRLAELLTRLDGLVLAGGGDIDPARYGAEPHERLYGVHAERDAQELQLVREVCASHLPTLAICRGLQVLNVALGGTLIQHLPDVVGETVLHRVPPRGPVPHVVQLAENSRLAGILQATEFSAASWHHQAIQTPGQGLRIAAHAPDGVIEAVEVESHPWLLGVQWHPELTAATDPIQQRLFQSFVEACA